jgi:hypothetical protein
MSKALAALANTVEPSLALELDFGLGSISSLPAPTVQIASLAVRLGMKRSTALYAILVLFVLLRNPPSFLALEGVFVDVVLQVPVNDHSDTPSSRRRGEFATRAMLDLGESRIDVLEMDRVNLDMRLPPWIDSRAPGTSGVCVRGVWGEGVNGIRPPAVRVEKMDERVLTGVKTAGLAMTAQLELNLTFLYAAVVKELLVVRQ